MSEEKKRHYELEEYIKQGEPGQIEKSKAWQTAIGLQAVDGLGTSLYLLDTAKEHIEGKSALKKYKREFKHITKSSRFEKKRRMIRKKRT